MANYAQFICSINIGESISLKVEVGPKFYLGEDPVSPEMTETMLAAAISELETGCSMINYTIDNLNDDALRCKDCPGREFYVADDMSPEDKSDVPDCLYPLVVGSNFLLDDSKITFKKVMCGDCTIPGNSLKVSFYLNYFKE